MIDKIEQGKLEFENKNFNEALKHFNQVKKDENGYKLGQIYKVDCLMELKQYNEALEIIDMLIEEAHDVEIFWAEKVRCHLFLNEDVKALEALKELERLCGDDDKKAFVRIAKLYSILDVNDKVIEYCDKALTIDENYKEALYEKLLVAYSIQDDEMIDDVSEDLLRISDNTLISILPLIMMDIFSEKYERALDLIENCGLGDIDEEHRQLLKSGVYKRICDDLNAQIMVSEKIDLDIRDAVGLMLEFKETGKDRGEVNGVQYFIM